MLITLISSFLITGFNPSAILDSTAANSKASLKPLRLAKAHYTLVQHWFEADASGKQIEKEQTVCDGDQDTPVFSFGEGDTIPGNEFRTIDCYAAAKPLNGKSTADAKPTHIMLNFFIAYINQDLFGASGMTKNFLADVRPDGVRMNTTGLVSTADLKASGITSATRSQATIGDNFQADNADYTVTARFVDESDAH